MSSKSLWCFVFSRNFLLKNIMKFDLVQIHLAQKTINITLRYRTDDAGIANMSHPLYGQKKKSKISFLHIIIALLVITFVGFFAISYKQRQDIAEQLEIEAKHKSELADKEEKIRVQRIKEKVEAEKIAFDEKKKKEQEKSDFLKSYDELNGLVIKWNDAVVLANSTSRIALSAPVSSMQEIRRNTDQLSVPSCLELPKNTLIQSMDHMIDGFIFFMEKSEYSSALEVKESLRLKDIFISGAESCKKSIDIM